MNRIHAKVSEAYTMFEDMLSHPEALSPFNTVLTFARIVERLKEALSLLEGDG